MTKPTSEDFVKFSIEDLIDELDRRSEALLVGIIHHPPGKPVDQPIAYATHRGRLTTALGMSVRCRAMVERAIADSIIEGDPVLGTPDA